MERTVTIKYRWEKVDGSEVTLYHVDYLEESALERISDQMQKGFVMGELHENLLTVEDPDGAEGTEYKGWWSVEKA